MLTLNNLSVSYGAIPALHELAMTVEEGEIVALLGNNGAGKSTTLRAISGLLPYQGIISYQGQDLKTIAPHLRIELGIAHVPEGRGIFGDLTVCENLKLATWGVKNIEIKKAYELFPRLAERKQQLASTLSGGEQQMLAIARAIIRTPKLLLLDEPSMGLAPTIVEDLFKTLGRTHQLGVSILLVEQNARLALKVAKRAYILENGRIVHGGLCQDLINDPAVLRSYLS